MQGGAGRCKNPRNGGGGSRGAGGGTREGGGAKRSKARAARGVIEANETTATAMSRRKSAMKDLLVRTHDNSTGGKYRVGRRYT